MRLPNPVRPLLRLLAAGLAAAWVAAVAAEPVALVPGKSEIAFASKQMGVPVEGRFKRFDARIVLDAKRPEAGNVAIAIDTGSATFGLPEPDSELPKPAWFDVARFPQATFQSTTIKALGDGRLEVTGSLKIKGFARDCVVPVTLAPGGGGTTTASGRFTVKRLDYKIGDGEWADTSMIGDDVQVMFKLVLTGL